jgi:hypothetical protein
MSLKAVEQVTRRETCGFSGDGATQHDVNWHMDWDFLRQEVYTKQIVLIRTNSIARTLAFPAGTMSKANMDKNSWYKRWFRGNESSLGYSLNKLSAIGASTLLEYEYSVGHMLKNACRSAGASKEIFVVTYESLQLRPLQVLIPMFKFLGVDDTNLDQETVMKVHRDLLFRKVHSTALFANTSEYTLVNRLFKGIDPYGVAGCYAKQARTALPKEETGCFTSCMLPSGLYQCP